MTLTLKDKDKSYIWCRVEKDDLVYFCQIADSTGFWSPDEASATVLNWAEAMQFEQISEESPLVPKPFLVETTRRS